LSHPSRSSLFAALLLLAAFGPAAAAARAAAAAPTGRPWESHPFAAPPLEVVRAAAAQVEGEEDAEEDVVVLLEEGRYNFDALGRCDYRYRMVFRLQTEAGVKEWASLETTWSPWYEERPEFRARVSTPDGEAHVLDPHTVAEAPVDDDDPTIYRDRRRLRAPLPGVAVGAVVEQEVRTRDRLPLFAAGTTYSFALGSGTPTRRARVVIEAPSTLPLHHALHGLKDTQVRHERGDGVERYQVEVGPLEAVPDAEPWMPADRPRRPYLAFATGASWQEVAAAYSRVVDTQTGTAPVTALRAGVKREEVAARLLEKLHKQVRYTGVEFGEAGVVPRSPAEVLARRYGDCKDTASLLVSQLRREGIPAYVALLSAGPGADVDARLPGLGTFDHAIVMMPGPPDLWIDTTNEFARLNELPIGDQDRLALVAAPNTTALLATPVQESGTNVVRKTREYLLADSGPGRVVETTHAAGQPGLLYRTYYADTPPKERRESQEKYAGLEHESTVVNVTNSDPRALNRPFELRVESAGAQRADTTGSTATALVNVASLFSRLPDAVGEEAAARRSEKFVMPEPHRVELTYRIVPPKGFEVRSLPDPVKESLGGAALEVNFTAGPDATVTGVLTFDTGSRVLEPSAYDELREKVRAWRAHDLLAVKFEHKAQALLESGRTCEGLGELRLSADADPAHAAPRERLAIGLLEAGLGEAAREEAARAVASEATSSSAQRTLGWVLEHDLLGRRFKPGADRAGAEAAYRRALALDAANALAGSSLAILLEHDVQGRHFGEGARLADAVVEVERLRKDLSYSFLNVNLMLSLLHLGRFEELEKLARSLPPDTDRNELVVTAVAAQRGAAEALTEAARLFPATAARRDALLHSGNSLVSIRAYPAAAALLAASVSGADDAAARRGRADLFARVRRYEEMALDPEDPRTVVKRLVITVAEYLAGKVEAAAFLDYAALEPGLRAAMGDHLEELRKGVLAGVRASASVVSRETVDVALSVGDFGLEGDAAGGYRVQIRAGGRSAPFYVVVRDGRPQVLIDRPAEDALAREAWRLFDAGDEERGWRWLDWARDGQPEVQSRDPLGRDAFLALWRAPGARSLLEGRLAAASLFVRRPQLEIGIRTLTAGSLALPPGAERQAVELALLRLYLRAGRTAEVLGLLEGFARVFPESRTALSLRVTMLLDLGRGPEAQALVAERLRARPDDEHALRAQASLSSRRGHFDEAERAFARLAELGRTEPPDLNNRAWNAVMRGAADDAAAEWARQAAQGGEAATLHTLATVYAEKGRVKESLEVLGQSVSASGDEIRTEDWYVIGRVAESCGLSAQARRAYERLKALKDDAPDSTGRLAARGLARLPPAGDAARRR
jgi:transglutaminase-like putative cysteine protease/Flp pilus assembly protein TadD